MSSEKNNKKPAFDVVPDTNIVFTKDNSQFFSPTFQKDWSALGDFADLNLLIPEIVREERLFRVSSVATTAIGKATRELSLVKNLAGVETPALLGENEVKPKVKVEFEKFLKQFGASVIVTPIEKIDWKDVIASAVWRIPPFIFEESSKNEKGFRDRLILETVVHHAESADNIAFLSGDEILRKAVAERFGRSEKRLVFESLEGFGSYLKLLDEQLTKKFVASLLKKVAQFWLENDPSKSAYHLMNVGAEVHKRFSIHLLMPSEKSALGIMNDPKQVVLWTAMSEEKVFIGSTEFQKKTLKDIYEWKTTVEFVQLFKRLPQMGLDFLDNKIRISKFDVFWTALVSDNAEFSKPTLKDIMLVETGLEWSNPMILAKYTFQATPSIPLPYLDWTKFLKPPGQ